MLFSELQNKTKLKSHALSYLEHPKYFCDSENITHCLFSSPHPVMERSVPITTAAE